MGCHSSLRVQRIRVSRLTPGGAPDTGPGKGYVSDAQMTVDVTLNTEAGTEVTQKNGGGRICATSKDMDHVKSVTVKMELCQLDMELYALLTGGEYQDCEAGDGPQSLYMPPSVSASEETPCCLEVWTDAWDGGAPAVTPSGLQIFEHWVFPLYKAVPDNFKLDENIAVFPVTGDSTENNAITPDGPFNDWPACVQAVGGITRVFGVFDDTVPYPDAQCGSIDVPAQPPPVAATGATSGTPGSFTPAGAQVPANGAAIASLTASPTAAWATGEWVQATNGDQRYWDGTAWQTGKAP